MCDYRHKNFANAQCFFAAAGAASPYRRGKNLYCALHAPFNSVNTSTNVERKRDKEIKNNINTLFKIVSQKIRTLDFSDCRIEHSNSFSFSNNIEKILFHRTNIRENLQLRIDNACNDIFIRKLTCKGSLKIVHGHALGIKEVKIQSADLENLYISSKKVGSLCVLNNIKCKNFTIPGIINNIEINNAICEKIKPSSKLISDNVRIISSDIKDISFDNSEIKDNFFSRDSTFGKFDFRNSTISRGIIFSRCKFFENFLFNINKFNTDNSVISVFADIEFNNCRFHKDVDFSNRKYERKIHFIECNFETAPSFFDAGINQNADFDKCKFYDFKKGAILKYRSLRFKMGEIKNHDMEGEFFSLEMRSKEKNKHFKFGVGLLSRIYGILSDYGRSPIRVLFFWIFITILSSIFCYYYIGDTCQRIECAAELSLQQSFAPFYVWKNKSICTTVEIDFILVFTTSLHSFLNIVMFSIAAICLRWQFRRA